MELRSCSHLHYIQVIKGGLATKLLNMYRGKPALKFKNVKDLYETEDTKRSDPILVVRPKLEFVELPIGCDDANTEILHRYAGERTTIKGDGETLECNSKGCDDAESELDDFNFGNMTLKQIKERCKGNKAKCCRYVGLNKETIETCSSVKQNHCNSQSEEDECDIMEPLSCWKSRILNKKKTKRKCKKKGVSASLQNALSIVKFEETPSDRDFFQTDGNYPAPIKVEAPEPAYSDCNSFSWNEPVASDEVVPCEEPESASDYDLEAGTSVIAFEELEIANDNTLLAGTFIIGCEKPETENDDKLEAGTSIIAGEQLDTAKDCVLETGRSVVSGEDLTANACGLETQMPASFSDELQCCVVNEESYEYVEHEDPKSTVDVQGSGGRMMMDGIAELVGHQFSGLSLSEAKKEDSVIYQHSKNDTQHSKNDTPETLSPSENHSPVMYYDHQGFPCVHGRSQETTSSNQVQVPDVTTNNSLQCVEVSERNTSCLPEGENKDDTLHVKATIISSPVRDFSSLHSSKLCSSPKSCLVSVVDHSLTAEEKQLPSPSFAHAARNISAEIRSDVDEPVILAKFEECHHSKLQHAPEKLFSTRMAISPTSQKRLREALESTELDDEQYYKYARKLCYSKQSENKVGRFEGANQIKRAEVLVSPKKAVRKSKIGNHGFHNNGTPKFPHPSRAVQRFSTGCTSVRSCSESAILFSLQQMHDIESVATKLAKELQFMKDIVDETLQSNVYQTASLKYSADEVKIAIQNATRVEESARRSLSIMARDCNRFCKIMKLTEKGSSASQNAACKKRKIVFADEAGGKLCDVKTFENGFYAA